MGTRFLKGRGGVAAALFAILLSRVAGAEQIAVRRVQRPMHRSMVSRAEDGKVIATGEFTQTVQGDEVTMHLVSKFADGSVDDETTTFSQRGTFRLVSNRHIQHGPYFTKAIDLTVESVTSLATSRTTDRNGKVHVESDPIVMPDDLANGFVGTLLLNVPPNVAPFRVGMVAPVSGGRLIRLLISAEGEQNFRQGGRAAKATVFRIHPELGGMVGVIARLMGLLPKDVMVWVEEGEEPAVVRIIGQPGGYGPLVSAELDGASFGR